MENVKLFQRPNLFDHRIAGTVDKEAAQLNALGFVGKTDLPRPEKLEKGIGRTEMLGSHDAGLDQEKETLTFFPLGAMMESNR